MRRQVSEKIDRRPRTAIGGPRAADKLVLIIMALHELVTTVYDL